MQAGILSQLPHGQAVLTKVLEVLEIAREHDFRIFFLRHMSLPAKLAGVFQLRQAMAWQRVDSPEAINPWFLRDSPGFELASELRVRADEAIFDKISMSAFEGTPLAMALRDCGLISFMVCGVIQRRKLRHVKLCSKLCLRFIVSQGLDFVWGINQPSHRGNGRPLGGASSLRADLGCTVR